MTNKQQLSANDMLDQMNMIKFVSVLKEAWSLVLKNPLMLFLVFAIPVLIAGILEQFVYPPIYGVLGGGGAIVIMLISLIFITLNAVIGFFGLGALVRATQYVNEGKAVNLNEIFSYVKDHFIGGIKLAIRLFFYTGAWIPIVYLLIMGGLATFGLYSGKAGVAMLGLVGLLGLLFIFVIIAYVILFFKKIINSSFSYIYFFTTNHPEVESSLQSSIKTCKNLTWTIFGNYLLMGIIIWLLALVLGTILIPIFLALGLYQLGDSALLTALISSVVGVLSFVFQYKLKEQVEAFRSGKSEIHHEEHHTVEHHNKNAEHEQKHEGHHEESK